MQTCAVVYVFYIHIKTTVGSEKLTKEKMKLTIVYTVSKRCCLAHITILVQIIHSWNETEREHHIVFILIAFFHNCYSIILWLSTNINVTPRIKNELLTSIFTVIRQMRNVTKWRSIVRTFNSPSSWSWNLS